VQLPRAIRETLLLQKLRYLDKQNLAINLVTTLGSMHKKIELLKKRLSVLLINNTIVLTTASILTLNKHLNSRRQTSI
jgi:CTP:phosphocholine cytidylyltransferase-like protein